MAIIYSSTGPDTKNGTPRTLTPNKKLLLKIVQSSPGLTIARYSELTGIPMDITRKALVDLAGKELIHFIPDRPGKIRNGRWYPGKAK